MCSQTVRLTSCDVVNVLEGHWLLSKVPSTTLSGAAGRQEGEVACMQQPVTNNEWSKVMHKEKEKEATETGSASKHCMLGCA